MLLASCVKETPTPQEKLNIDPHHITQEQALRTMNTVMGQLYSGTRAIKGYTIQTLKGRDLQKAGTRFDDDAPIFPEDVLYIVNFDDDEGFAVLAADDRIPEVIAITTSGSLSISDFELITEVDTLEQLEPGRIIGNIIAGGLSGRFPDDDIFPRVNNIDPLLTTRWCQETPFNDLCFGKKAGCAAVAVSQLIAYHATIPISQFYIYTSTWDDLKDYTYGMYWPAGNQMAWVPTIARNPQEVANRVNIAELVFDIGVGVGIKYWLGGSGTDEYKIADYLENELPNSYFYFDSNQPFYNLDTVINELVLGNPVLICASAYIDAQIVGHLWLIDGYSRRFTGQHIANLLHCNWGWGGKCDGYYISGMFKTHEPYEYDLPGISNLPCDPREYSFFDFGLMIYHP